MRKLGLNVLVTLISVFVALGAIEAYLRIAQPFEMRLKGTEIRLPYYQTYELINEETYDGKLDPVASHTKNGLGFRGPNPPSDFAAALTVLMAGGSTTEGFYIDDSKTWPMRVSNVLAPVFNNLWINNAGLDGHSSFGHLHLFEQHLKGLAPDVIVYLAGGNDMDGLIERTRYDDTLNYKPVLDPNRSNPIFREWMAKKSELVGLLLAMYERRKVDRIDGSSFYYFRNITERGPVALDTARNDDHRENFVPGYRERMTMLTEQTLSAGILPVLMTHPASFGYAGTIDPDEGIDVGHIGYKGMNGATAWTILELYNDVTRAIAIELDVPLIDLARMPKNTRHFSDQIHFSIPGTQAVADYVAPRLCPILRERFPDHAEGDCPPG